MILNETHGCEETHGRASLRIMVYQTVWGKGKIATIDRNRVSYCRLLARALGIGT